MLERIRSLGVAALALGFAAAAHAGPAMFSGSLVQQIRGNDYTAGGFYPYNTYVFTALPIGQPCGSATSNGGAAPYYCGHTTRQAGQPASGSGTISLTATGTGPVPFQLPQSALAVTASGSVVPRATGFPNTPMATPGYYLSRMTDAAFANAAGSFFAGGGPGNLNFFYGPLFQGAIQITAGPARFGGVMGLLGKLNVTGAFTLPGKSGQWSPTKSWDMADVLGRTTSYAITTTGMFVNATLRPKSTDTRTMMATGFPWTTGMVFMTVRVGAFTTSMHRTGYDDRTALGLGNIQLVTPALTHWINGSPGDHTGQIGVLTLHFVPEPGAGLLLAAGAGLLVWLRRVGARAR
jgi:hypothetical protein